MNPTANQLRRSPLSRCLDRVHQYAKDSHKGAADFMVGSMLAILRMRDAVVMRVEGRVPEPNMFPPVEGEDDDDFDDEDEEFWDDEEFG